MKKKIIVPIVISGISLVLGGLIYLGISAFPELLEEEEVVKEEEPKCLLYVGDRNYAAENNSLGEPANNAVSSNGISNINYDSDVEFVVVSNSTRSVKGSFKAEGNPHKDFSIVEYQPIYVDENNNELTISISKIDNTASSCEKEEAIVSDSSLTQSEDKVISDDCSHCSTYSDSEERITHETTKTKKARVNKTKTMHSYEALVGTSLLVIGAVDVIAMAATRRKKHLFR